MSDHQRRLRASETIEACAREVHAANPGTNFSDFHRELSGHLECLISAQSGEYPEPDWTHWLSMHHMLKIAQDNPPVMSALCLRLDGMLAAALQLIDKERAKVAEWQKRVEDLARELEAQKLARRW